MKRFLTILVALLALCLILSSCNSAKEEEKASEKETEKEKIEETEEDVTEPEEDSKEPEINDETADSEEDAEVISYEEYDSILNDLICAFPWTYDNEYVIMARPEMSYLYYYFENLSDIGYTVCDIDGNGVNELLIGVSEWNELTDVYTIKDGNAVSLFSSSARNNYLLLNDGRVINTWSGGAALTGTDIYKIVDGELVLEKRLTIDASYAYESGIIEDFADGSTENCYFVSETVDKSGYVSISEEEADAITEEINALRENAVVLDLIPLSE